ncbi:hypothetical protein [Streptomyces sp. NPDC003032]
MQIKADRHTRIAGVGAVTARVLDGALTAGPTPDGSFLLRAAFPAPGHGLMEPERRLTTPRTATAPQP